MKSETILVGTAEEIKQHVQSLPGFREMADAQFSIANQLARVAGRVAVGMIFVMLAHSFDEGFSIERFYIHIK